MLDTEPAPFFDAVTDTLDRLRNEGYLLAVATGKSRRGFDRVLSGHRMTEYFDTTRCADETSSKPHPHMLHELLTHFELDPEQACMVGDTEFDMEMAVRANVPRIGVSYGAHSADRLACYDLLCCVDGFAEIVRWL